MKGVGTDLIEVERIRRTLELRGDAFAKRILSDNELAGFVASKQQADFLAKRFAIKEAVSKALGTGIAMGVSWKDIELGHLESGQPYVTLHGKAKERLAELGAEGVYVSLSDEAGLVSAFAVMG